MGRFQFSVVDLFIFMTAAAVWIAAARVIGRTPGNSVPLTLFIFAAMAWTVYQIAREFRYGWAIAIFAAPTSAVAVLWVASVFSR